ncbi:MAG TPA: accessory factor UbiK family protein [Chromatiales bacterium]|nr:accessory factor UbiK family protein [Chromatiales bacterium]
MALDPKLFDELTRKLTGVLPESARELQEDLEKNARALLSTTLDKMDLVTREEFDVQKAVLARTRAKLEALEKQVAELEQALSTSGPART